MIQLDLENCWVTINHKMLKLSYHFWCLSLTGLIRGFGARGYFLLKANSWRLWNNILRNWYGFLSKLALGKPHLLTVAPYRTIYLCHSFTQPWILAWWYSSLWPLLGTLPWPRIWGQQQTWIPVAAWLYLSPLQISSRSVYYWVFPFVSW